MTRTEYLAKLDAFMLHLGADITEGRVLGCERHEEALAILIRQRKVLDVDAPRHTNGHERALLDGLEAAERGLRDVRAACRACGKAV
jgi:hypothetical protein